MVQGKVDGAPVSGEEVDQIEAPLDRTLPYLGSHGHPRYVGDIAHAGPATNNQALTVVRQERLDGVGCLSFKETGELVRELRGIVSIFQQFQSLPKNDIQRLGHGTPRDQRLKPSSDYRPTRESLVNLSGRPELGKDEVAVYGSLVFVTPTARRGVESPGLWTRRTAQAARSSSGIE